MSEVIYIAPETLTESPYQARKLFSREDLRDLQASIESKGVLTPLLVRSVNSHYEVVAGHRRRAAAIIVGLKEVPVLVNTWTDEEAQEIGIIDNLQRADIHPLDEAAAYKELRKRIGGIEDIAAKVGKSRQYVAVRLQLNELIEPAKKLYREGKLSPSHANQIARLPQSIQKELFTALKTSLNQYTDTELAQWIRERLLTSLSKVPWDLSNPGLYVEAGSCSACPKRTHADKDLFADTGREDRCLDHKCFQHKMELYLKAQMVAAKEKYPGKDIVRIVTEFWSAEPDVLSGSKYRKADKACKDTKIGVIVVGPDTGKTLEICTNDKCLAHGAVTKSQATSSEKERQQRKALALEKLYRAQVFKAVWEKATPSAETPKKVATYLINRFSHDETRWICNALGLEVPVIPDRGKDFRKALSSVSVEKLLVMLPYVGLLGVNSYSQTPITPLIQYAKERKVTADALRRPKLENLKKKPKEKTK